MQLVLNLLTQVGTARRVPPWPKPNASPCWLKTVVLHHVHGRASQDIPRNRSVRQPAHACRTICRCSSRSCAGSAGDGAPAIMSRAAWFLGKAITSRMLGAPVSTMHSRSSPEAIPPCGGVPNSKASSKCPNRSRATSTGRPIREKTFSCNSRR
ncbi:MAG: hypothetical protein HW404_2506 [Anaerolineales bacterium]|nr:hypothetical protein [Anaerolineales bacterium]